MAKATVASLDEVPEALRGEYESRDGKFVLKIEGEPAGFVPVARFNEFRDNNRALNTRVTTAEEKLKAYEGIDPSEYAALKTRIAEFEKNGAKAPADLQKLIEQAIAPVQQTVLDLRKKNEEAEERVKQATLQSQRKDLESTLQSIGLKNGVAESALPDYVARGMRIFSIVDGKPVAKNGETPIYAKDGEALTPEKWATELVTEAPHLFKASVGGGATNKANANTGGAGQIRTIAAGSQLTAQDLKDIAAGTAVREEPKAA